MTGPDIRRLFLALWPNEAVRVALHKVQQCLPPGTGRAVHSDNLHITLVFLGSTPAVRRECIEQALDRIKIPGFTLQLDRLGYWRKPQVLWAGSDDVPTPLTSLVDETVAAAVRCGAQLDTRPFRPHLTLFRKVRKPPRDLPPVAPILWPADSFAMVESITAASGVCYKALKTWTLVSASADGASEQQSVG